MDDYKLRVFVEDELHERKSFEDILEYFDLSPAEVFIHLFHSGMIDERILEAYILDV